VEKNLVKWLNAFSQILAQVVSQGIVGMGVLLFYFDQAVLTEGSEMLGNGGFGQGDFFDEVIKGCFAVFEQIGEDDNSGGMCEGFGPE
jgi:hypothetical protein